MQTLTIMPDAGGAYVWCHDDDPSIHSGVGGLSGLPMIRKGMRMHPHPMTKEFEDWQTYWERNWSGSMTAFDWRTFHAEGIALSRRLKKSLGEKYRIVYEKPCEDPGFEDQERREVMMDGDLIDLPSQRAIYLAKVNQDESHL
jgi:hypothetical protein